MKFFILVAALMTLSALCGSCGAIDPRQNFDEQVLRNSVGKRADGFYHMRPELLLEKQKISNDKFISKYKYLRGCVIVIETDGGIITSASTEGDTKNCILPP